MNIIEIEGIKYRNIETTKKRSIGSHSSMMDIFGVLLALTPNFHGTYSRPFPTNDIIKEFTLIQQKKSALSKRDRERVIYEFNKSYKLVKEEDFATPEQKEQLRKLIHNVNDEALNTLSVNEAAMLITRTITQL